MFIPPIRMPPPLHLPPKLAQVQNVHKTKYKRAHKVHKHARASHLGALFIVFTFVVLGSFFICRHTLRRFPLSFAPKRSLDQTEGGMGRRHLALPPLQWHSMALGRGERSPAVRLSLLFGKRAPDVKNTSVSPLNFSALFQRSSRAILLLTRPDKN